MKFLNIHDLLFILAVVIATHMLAKPLYAAIDNSTGNPTPNAS